MLAMPLTPYFTGDALEHLSWQYKCNYTADTVMDEAHSSVDCLTLAIENRLSKVVNQLIKVRLHIRCAIRSCASGTSCN